MASAALAACAPAQRSSGSSPNDSVQLVYQDWRTPWFPALAQQMLEQFHTSHPNIHVFYAPDPPDLREQMTADVEARTAPDVLDGCCEFFPFWAQKGYLLDLRPYVEADLDRATIDDWDKAQYQALFTPDGTQFALPKYHGALALYYNMDLFDRRGVDYPDSSWTNGDYEEAMLRLTSEANADGRRDVWGSMIDVGWDRVQVHINSWGGHIVDPANPRRSLLVEPECLAALRWLHGRIWDDRCMATSLDVQNLGATQAFTRGRLAMVEDGSWSLKSILENVSFRVGVAPFPAGPARKVTLATTDGFGIYAGTRYPEAAWELLKFLTAPGYGRAMARVHLIQPARASLVEEWIDLVHAQHPKKSRDMDLAVFAQGHIQGHSVVAETFANMEESGSVLNAAFQEILTLGRAPVEVMYEVMARIEEAQDAG